MIQYILFGRIIREKAQHSVTYLLSGETTGRVYKPRREKEISYDADIHRKQLASAALVPRLKMPQPLHRTAGVRGQIVSSQLVPESEGIIYH